MLKEYYCVVVFRAYDHNTFDFDNEPSSEEILEILKKEKVGSIAKIEKRYKIVETNI